MSVDAYAILGVSKQFELEELRTQFKKQALKLHPDKGGDEHKFKILMLCYKKLFNEYKNREIDKQFDVLKTQSKNSIDTQNTESPFDYVHSNNFLDVFNAVFEENRMSSPYDHGYGNIMEKSTQKREDIHIEKKISNMKEFDKVFNELPITRDNTMIKYEGPTERYTSDRSLHCTTLGEGEIQDFSGYTNNLEYTDYYKAHNTQRLIDPSQVNMNRCDSVEKLKAERENVRCEMNQDELREYFGKKHKAELFEQERINRLAKYDKETYEKSEKINRMLMQFKR